MLIIKSQKIILSLGKCYIWKDWSHRIRGGNFAVDKEQMHGFDACALTKSELSSLDFIVNRFFMKLFKTNNIDVVKSCQSYLF